MFIFHVMLLDFHAFLVLPFGALEIEHVINASLILLPNNRILYIATDDEQWLHEAMAEYRSKPGNLISTLKFHIYSFPARKGHRQSVSTEVAAEFFATIEVGQQCHGFVGHTGRSSVAQLFFESMCYKNQYDY